MEAKHGEVWINQGFWDIYKVRRHVSYVRILKVTINTVTLRSLADTLDGSFSYGSGNNPPFILSSERFYAIFRKATSEELVGFSKERSAHRILYANSRDAELV